MTYSYISIGSNAGNSRRHLNAAVRALGGIAGARMVAASPLYHGAPVNCPGNQRAYYNAAVELQTALPPPRLFQRLRRLEKNIQKKKRPRNAARRLDVDYVAHGNCRMVSRRLTLPHARMFQRRFVLQPIADILARAAGGGRRNDCNDHHRRVNRRRVHAALNACRHQQLWRACWR